MKVLGKFPLAFWVANSMEIFERMAWYGFFVVSSLYLRTPVDEGGLGLPDVKRGIIQGVVPFLLYLFPVVTGALGDKFGYKRTFLVAYLIMTPGYYLLGLATGFWDFFFIFLLVAVGAALFKPIVVGTVSHVTTEKTKALGFGIFYMMVNIGGFFGPIVAGIVRDDLGWPWVFKMSTLWIACNFFLLLIFYREPKGRAQALEAALKKAREIFSAGKGAGTRSRSGQFTAAALRLVPSFVAAGLLLDWQAAAIALLGLFLATILILLLVRIVPEDVRLLLRKSGSDIVEVLGNPTFFTVSLGTLVILMLAGGKWITWGEFGLLTGVLLVSNLLLDIYLRTRDSKPGTGLWAPARIGNWRFVIYLLLLAGLWTEFYQLFVTLPLYIQDYTNTHDILAWLADVCSTFGLAGWEGSLRETMASGRQIKPEYLVNIDAGLIILFVVLVSYLIARWKPFNTMASGIVLIGIGLGLLAIGTSGWIVVLAVSIFSFGEMMASPKSQEYVSRIAPPDKQAMYMGYYFVSGALGNLFGGIMSGQMYGHFGKTGVNDPHTMWLIFGAIGLFTAAALFLYDRLIIRRPQPAAGSR